MKTITERISEIEKLTRELQEYVEKYGFDLKNGGLTYPCTEKACGDQTPNESGLCDSCECKEATE